MGWNTSALFVRGESAVAVVGDGFVATGESVGADEATSAFGEGLFAAEGGGWGQVWDPSCVLVPACRPGGTALIVVFSSVASTYAFTLFEGGREVRQWVFSEGEQVVDTGTPLPVEQGIDVPSWGPDEDYLWAVVEAVTGQGFDDAAQFQVYRSSRSPSVSR